jgi:hypothetical protein
MREVKLIILGVLCAPSIIFCQSKNRVSIQTGLMHCFFDRSPLINFKYPSKEIKPLHGIFLSSVGLQYSHNINSDFELSIETNYFYVGYRKPIIEEIYGQAISRGYLSFNFTAERFINFSKKNYFTYGCGIDYRHGAESIGVAYGEIAPGINEVLVEVCRRRDFGLISSVGYEYRPLRFLSLFTKIDLLGMVYINDKAAQNRLKEFYGISKYPSRFDLSMKLGVGFNF